MFFFFSSVHFVVVPVRFGLVRSVPVHGAEADVVPAVRFVVLQHAA